MLKYTEECNHCGKEYLYYLSGSYIPNHNSKEYCPSCEESKAKAVAAAFKEIPVLFQHQYIKTDDYTLDELLKIEKEQKAKRQKEWEEGRVKAEEEGKAWLPLMHRVYSTLTNSKTGEVSGTGRIKHSGESYSYFYWPSKPEEAEIKVEKRIDMTTGKPV